MGHTVALVLLIAISQQIQSIRDLSVPFTHDFNTGLHGWNVGNKAWNWTGNDYKNIPITTNIPFDRDSNYIWSQKSCLATERISQNHLLYFQSVTNVMKNSKFHLKYWFYTKDLDCGFLSFSLMTNERATMTKTITHNSSSNGWDDVTIDCQLVDCCMKDNCDINLFISGSVGCTNAEDLIMIRSVSATLSEVVTPTNNLKLSIDHTTAKPEYITIPEDPPTSSAWTTSNDSITTSRGPTTVPATTIIQCLMNKIYKHILADHITLRNRRKSATKKLDRTFYNNNPTFDFNNNPSFDFGRVKKTNPLFDDLGIRIPKFENTIRYTPGQFDFKGKTTNLEIPKVKSIGKTSAKIGGGVVAALAAAFAYFKCKKVKEDEASEDVPDEPVVTQPSIQPSN